MALDADSHDSSKQQQQLEIVSTDAHCMGMGDYLYHYVQPKIHPEIRNRKWGRIIVRGCYNREPSAKSSDLEKRDKDFNWHRPTTSEKDDHTLYLNCFPGESYVRHYASLVATFLSLTGRDPSIVEYELPTESDCLEPLLRSNLPDMGQVDIVLVGYVQQLEDLVSGPWEGKGNSNNIFAWKKSRTRAGQPVALLGCMPSFWGDISGHLIRVLRKLNSIKCFLYIGKGGSLSPEDIPNKTLATGERSFIGERAINWYNVLQPDIDRTSSKLVATGKHVTVQTPLCESDVWLQEWQTKSRWVDCEVGHMAQACNELGLAFGYLHIVSDNLWKPLPYNISNERLEAVVVDRQKLLGEIRWILTSFFARWSQAGDDLSNGI